MEVGWLLSSLLGLGFGVWVLGGQMDVWFYFIDFEKSIGMFLLLLRGSLGFVGELRRRSY